MSKLIDLTDQDFGYWKVLSRAESTGDGRARWNCLCTACGKEKIVQGTHLRSGRSTNCGCIRMEKMRLACIKDETNKTYGFLKVNRMANSEEVPRKDREGIYWNCTCLNCGRENVIIFGDYLRNGNTSSCGCITSVNESKIAKMLDALGITYIQQYSFEDLTKERKCDRLYFDFAIFNNNTLIYLIEYDGIQHFDSRGNHWGKQENFQKTHENDLIKNAYCFKNNIPLIRIPYNKPYNLKDLKLETTNFLFTLDTEKQYYNFKGE